MSGSSGGIGKQSYVRIIGGRWRGRKLAFTAVEGLRPTGDRIRETLFNWLTPHLDGARCLDLFAGSGALGLEALSRGASYCDFVDSSSAAVRQVKQHLLTLDAMDKGHCHLSSALNFLQSVETPYDIVFIDPPFKLHLVAQACAALAERRLLGHHALVYVEATKSEPIPAVPAGWVLHRDKSSGAVAYRLFAVDALERSP